MGEKQHITLTDLFLHDSNDVVEVKIPKLGEGALFKLRPIREADRRRWQAQYKLCRTCGGLGFIPMKERASTCPTCNGGANRRSFDDPEIRKGTLADFCFGWSGWITEQKTEIPFSEAMRDKVAELGDVYFAIREAADNLLRKVEDDEGKG